MTDTLRQLESTIAARRAAGDVTGSYVARLSADGPARIARKLGEEAVETVIAGLTGSTAELVAESADLIFHLLVLLAERGVGLAEVEAELARREGLSGITEKAARVAASPAHD